MVRSEEAANVDTITLRKCRCKQRKTDAKTYRKEDQGATDKER